MLKWLITTPLYLARRVAKSQKPSPLPSPHTQSHQLKRGTIESDYKLMKQKFESIDKQDAEAEKNTKNLERSFNFVQNLMKEEERKDENKQLMKQKPKIQDKLRKMGTPEELIIDKKVKNEQMERDESEVSKLVQIIAKQSGSSIQSRSRQANRDLLMAQQELMLQQIMKKTKEKEVKMEDSNSQVVDPAEKEKKLILRKQKIIEALQKNTDPTQSKFNFTTEDLLTMKYSPQILAKAHQYKNKELGYFKKLISEDEQRNPRHSRLNKRHYKDEKDEEKFLKQLQQQSTPPVLPVKQNSYKNIKHEEGLQLYEDDQFYKKKAIKQFSEKLSSEDLKLKEQLNKDLELGEKASDVFLDEVVYKKEAKLQKRLIYQDTSFGRQDALIKNLDKKLKNLGVEFNRDQIKALSNQLLFEQKHFLESQQGFQKYLQRKEKKKNMKKQLKQIHKNVLRDDVNFDKQQEPTMSVKQIKQSSDFQLLQQNYERLEEYQAQKQSVLVQQTPDEKQTQVHRKKTFKNMQNFIAQYFSNGLSNHNMGQLQEIELLEVIPNQSNTVMNIFWNISKDYLLKKGIVPGINNYQELFQKQKKKVEIRLKKQSTYISGKMTQFLKLRYGPEIRFYFDTKTQKTLEAVQQLSKFTKEIAMVQLQEYQKKGLIKSESQEIEYYEKLLNVAKGKVLEFNSRKQILSKTYQKFHQVQEEKINDTQKNGTNSKKKKRKNPIREEEMIGDIKDKDSVKMKKKNASDRLWDSIDLL